MEPRKGGHKKHVLEAVSSCTCSILLQHLVKHAGKLRIKFSKLLVVAKLLAFLVLLCVTPLGCVGVFNDTIEAGISVSAMSFVDFDGYFLNSMAGEFALAFTEDTYVYLCIRHAQSQRIVWTANRDSPAATSDNLVFTPGGNVYWMHGSKLLWSTNTTGRGVTKMQMLDTGNLVLLDSQNKTVWQSFDHPTDTLLTGQFFLPQFGMKLVSSVSDSNMSSSAYTLALESGDLRLVYGDAALPYWSMSEDTRVVHSVLGAPSYAVLNTTGLSLVSNESVVISLISLRSGTSLARATLEADGNFHLYVYSSSVWTSLFDALQSGCNLPFYCGHLGLCSGDQCTCPDSLQPLNKTNITQGCQGLPSVSCTQNAPLQGSFHFEKIGDHLDYFANPFVTAERTSGLEACQDFCRQNCTCSYLFFYNDTGSCFTYSELGTIQSSSSSKGSLYTRTNSLSESPGGEESSKTLHDQSTPSYLLPLIIGGSLFLIFAMMGVFLYWYFKLHRLEHTDEDTAEDDLFLDAIPGLPTRFTFRDLQVATNNFSKKLGAGGFGSVYEGVLPGDKTKVAVKQLESIGQGKKEFRAEVGIIGSIHHMHLVQLRGFCAEGPHRLLVYEYMANGSLDKSLFPVVGSTQLLDWKTRYKIALGTARGLAYLHDDCREKIIHCDIKPENILLDKNFSAKVSDFGLAKLLNKEQSQVFTTMRGTRGYLAPEWLMNLAISEKSDVYSFGMVLLEIISGRKNYEPAENSENRYFPALAFTQAEAGCLEELVDERLKGTVDISEAVNTFRIALWCIQEEIPSRPSMAKVVQMLEGNLRVPDPPLSSQFAVRLHARMVEATNSSHHTSSTSETISQYMLSAIQLSEAR